MASMLGARFAHQPGAALFIDYGYCAAAPGSTLRALRRHHAVSALAAPGTADLSAHVDFAAFAEAARAAGAETHGPVGQGRFLAALGAGLRLAALSARATPAQRWALESGVSRLLDPGEMGDLFKVLAIVSPGLATLGGFDAAGEP
jgi:NADH dehydrogenase [ubiquinone] 1 alpha subcomplex assembly factor 7